MKDLAPQSGEPHPRAQRPPGLMAAAILGSVWSVPQRCCDIAEDVRLVFSSAKCDLSPTPVVAVLWDPGCKGFRTGTDVTTSMTAGTEGMEIVLVCHLSAGRFGLFLGGA